MQVRTRAPQARGAHLEASRGPPVGKVGYHAVQQDRMLRDGKLNAYWIMCNNNLQTAPNTDNETYPGYRNPVNFVVVSDPYPTVTAMAADLILPTPCGWRRRAPRQRRAAHALSGTSWSTPGEARSDLWQLMELSKRFTTDEVWPEEISPRRRSIAARACSMCSSRTVRLTSSRCRTWIGLRKS